MHVPKHFWADVIFIVYFLINRMSSSVLNCATPYHQLFPNNSLFPIDPKVFGCTCFFRDVHLHVSKLDSKSLKCIFVGYSCVKKGYRCYCPAFRRYVVSIDVTFFETIPFSLSFPITSQGEGDDLLVYTISSLVPPAPLALPAPSDPTPTPVFVKPPIT